ALHQRVADEDFARLGRVDLAEMDAPPGVDRQAIQRGTLVGDDLPGLAVPARIGPRPAQQMGARPLEPRRLDAGHAACIQTGGLDQFGGHDPAPGLLDQTGARMDLETYLASP